MERVFLLCVALFASAMFAADPAILHTKVVHGRAISFWVENHYPAPITRFQVAAISAAGNLGCSITAEVKQPKDLHPRGTCGFTTSGADSDRHGWKARLVRVEFSDGMQWIARSDTR